MYKNIFLNKIQELSGLKKEIATQNFSILW